jgi:cytochrome P450
MDELSEGLPLTMGELLAGRIITAADPPKRIRLRGAINRAFLPGQMAQWTGFVENEVAELTADLDGTEPFDLMQRLAVPLPVADLDMIEEAVCLRGLWQ